MDHSFIHLLIKTFSILNALYLALYLNMGTYERRNYN